MADAKLTALTAASALAGADLYYISQGGVSKKATHTQLLTLVGTAYVPLAGGTMTGALTIASGTLTASAPALNTTQTWTTGAAFTGALMNITDTSSTAGSLLQDWQVGGVSKFNIIKDGSLTAAGTITTANIVCNNGRVGIGNSWDVRLGSTSNLVWTSGTYTATADIILYRDAAATLAQRNGATQQTFRLYNTYTDSSNYERLTLTGVAGTSVNITAETLGTGADNLDIVLTPAGTGAVKVMGPVGSALGNAILSTQYLTNKRFDISVDINGGYFSGYNTSNAPQFRVDLSDARVTVGSIWGYAWTSGDVNAARDTGFNRGAAGQVDVTNGTAATYRDLKLRNLVQTEYSQLTEMTAPSAPATNSVRIYAEDNGSGKTRLMALFATGVAQQLAIEP